MCSDDARILGFEEINGRTILYKYLACDQHAASGGCEVTLDLGAFGRASIITERGIFERF